MSVFAGTVLRRNGPVRTSQLALAAVALGLFTLAAGGLPAFFFAAALIGCGYALTNPAGAEMLARSTTAQRRNLVFSIKQTAVPLGGILAGLALPLLSAVFGWQAAFVLTAGAITLIAIALQPLRRVWDQRMAERAAAPSPPLAALRQVLKSRPLRSLAATGFLYSTIQLALASYGVVMLVSEFGWSLVAAGSGAAALQFGGVIGRVLWGAIADRVSGGFGVLAIIGIATTAITWLLPTAIGAPPAFVIAVLFALGVTAVGWNGVLLADTTRHVDAVDAGGVTAIVLMFTFSGVVLGPLTLAAFAWLTGSYAMAFAILATAPLAAALLLLLNRST